MKALFKGPVSDIEKITVDGSSLASGIYFARVTDPIRRRSLAEAKVFLVK
ncbi:hypothetical protein IT157_04435 [bacterium]|nr:hypothetical protein [bacterium]